MTFNAEKLYGRNSESLEGATADEFMSLVEPKVEQAISMPGITNRLNDGEKLNVKFGTDPTGPDLHLGHIVPIKILDLFGRAGHNVDLIFGDFTAKVGDPTGRDDGRKVLTDEDINQNVSTFQNQVDTYFDTNMDNVTVHRNSEWLGRMALKDIFGYLQATNLTEATQRNDFRTRMERGQSVSLAEAMYGTLMGIDSVELETDIEVGGLDQLLNFQQTRSIQRSVGQKAEEIIMTPIIQGTSGDGNKMSKSLDNYIAARSGSDEVFGKMMSIPDTLILPYTKAFAPVYATELEQIDETIKQNPLESKKQLATFMAAVAGGEFVKGTEAREAFERKFTDKNVVKADAAELIAGDATSLMDVLRKSGDFKSNGDLRRIAEQGGVRINDVVITVGNLFEPVEKEALVRVGKRRLYVVK